jgi:NADPH:quinone reductase-like Zn-dependent oxidoreductase
VRAVLIEEIGRPPVVRDVPDPEPGAGEALVEVLAAPLNPIDVSIASGRFYQRPSELPYVAGKEAVGRVLEAEGTPAGTRVYVPMPGGLGGPGSFRERAAVPGDRMVAIPQDADEALAACLGVAGLAAWLPLEWRARLRGGERVLILGASGAVGQIAVQAAKLLGAGRVIAAARSEDGRDRALELGADAAVDLGAEGPPDGLAAAVREAAGGAVDVTLDLVWGGAAAVAVHAAAQGGRIVHVGQSAGPEATLPSAPVRSKELAILGHSNQATPPDVVADAYLRMVRHAAAGDLTVDHEVIALEDAPAAWERQAAFPRRKLVLRP